MRTNHQAQRGRRRGEDYPFTRRRGAALVLMCGVALGVTGGGDNSMAGETVPQNIVVIGWDGAQRAHVREMIERGEVPNLMALAKEGRLVDIDVTTGATDTKAGWTQILTGYRPDKTGVFSNGHYQPIPAGYTLFERLEAFFGPTNIDTVAIIGKKEHVDADPPQKVPYEQWLKKETRQKRLNKKRAGLGNLQGGRMVEEEGVKYVLVPGKPWLNAASRMDLFVNGLLQNDRVGQRALAELDQRKDRRFFFFVHFAAIDRAGHQYGENSRDYTEAVKSDDEWTGKIAAKLRELGLYDKTRIYVVVDHGFNEGEEGHRHAPSVFMGTNDPEVIRNGDRADIAPTLLRRLGLDLTRILPPLDGCPLDQPAP